MKRRGEWPRAVAAAATGVALGVMTLASGALLLYTGRGLLSSSGFMIALAAVSVTAGIWVGAPDGPAPGHSRMAGRWVLAVGAVVLASFVATLWLRFPGFQSHRFGPPLALVLLLAEPAYALGALLAALEARRRGWLAERWILLRSRAALSGGRAGGVVVPALLGLAAGVMVAAIWLVPLLPPGPVFLVVALLLTGAGSLEMSLAGEPKGDAMAEQVVVVTGVGRRGQVGYAVARAFADRGAGVVVTGRTDEIESIASELGDRVVGVVADLAEPAGADRVVEAARSRWGRIDVLVNVAGGLHVMKPLSETTPEEWERELRANAATTFLMTRAALPLLREAGGVVIHFASPAGERAVKGMAAYSAAKAGVVALTRALALEERERGVRVNAVAPGMVDTEQNRAAVEDPQSVKWVTREEIVEVVLFLASAASSGVNGQVLHVPGRGAF